MSALVESTLVRFLEEGIQSLRHWRKLNPLPLQKPKPIVFTLISERRAPGMATDTLTYNAKLPVVSQPDVVSQFFAVSLVTLDGENEVLTPVKDVNLGVDVKDVDFDVPQDSTVELRLTYADDAGNVGPVQSQRFVAKDTIAPDAPGAFGEITLVKETEGVEPETGDTPTA